MYCAPACYRIRLQQTYQVSEHRAGQGIGLSNSSLRYRSRRPADEQQAVAEDETIQQQIFALNKANQAADSARDAGTAYREGLKAQRDENPKTASDKYQLSIATYKGIGDKAAVADISYDLGRMLLAAEEEAPEDVVPVQMNQRADEPGTKEVPPNVVDIVLGTDEATPAEARAAVLRSLKLSSKDKALKHYGDAVKTYREMHDYYSATLLDELGELLHRSLPNGWPRYEGIAASDIPRAQTAIEFFCEAQEDYRKKQDDEKRLLMLVKIGSRLNAKADGQAGRPSLIGCSDIGSEPSAYFDRAAAIYGNLIQGAAAAHDWELAQKRRKDMVSMLFLAGQDYLYQKDAEPAKKFFDRAADVYSADSDQAQRDEKSKMLFRIGDAYRTVAAKEAAGAKAAEGEANAAKAYFEKAADVYGDPNDPEQRKARAGVFVKIGEAYVKGNGDVAKEYFDRAADVHLKAKDLESAAQTMYSIGLSRVVPEGEIDTWYYLWAVETYEKAGNTGRAVEILYDPNVLIHISTLGTQGFTAKKKEIFQKASLLYDRLGTPDQRFDALINLGSAYLGVRSFLEARETYFKAAHLLPVVKTDRKLGDLYYRKLADLYFGYGQMYEAMGVHTLAARYYDSAGKLYEKTGQVDEKAATDEALKRMFPGVALKGHPVNLEAELKGDAIGGLTPGGRVEFKIDPDGDRELTVKVTDVNLPARTTLSVLVDGKKVGTFRLRDGKRGKFVRDTGEEEDVPKIGEREQTLIVVKDDKGRTILEGTISGAPRVE